MTLRPWEEKLVALSLGTERSLMEESVQGNKMRRGWTVMKERKHDHTEDGNTEDMITAPWRLKMVTLKKNYRVRGTVYGVHHTVLIMPSRRQMAARLWVWSSTTTIITKTRVRSALSYSVLFLLLDLGADRLLVFMENFCSFSWITEAGRSALGNGYWQLVGR